MFIIFDSSSGQLSEQPTLISLIEVFGKRDLSKLYFWTLGHEDWIPLSQVLTSQLVTKRKYQMPSLPSMDAVIPTPPTTPVAPTIKTPPIPQTPVNDEVTQKIQTKGHDKSNSGNPKEARRSPRYELRIKVILSNKEKTFLSYTQNVSTTGVLLEDVIPTDFFQNEETEIFISSPKRNEFLAFRCRPVGDQSSPMRFTFGEISQDALSKFQDWIDRLRKDS